MIVLFALSMLLAADGRAAPPSQYSRAARPSPIISLYVSRQEALNNSLRIAARRGNLEGATEALRAGAQVDGASQRGRTSLMYAARMCSPELVRLLLKRGADADARDEMDRPALIYAVREGCVSVARILIRHGGARVRGRDKLDKTALDYARKGTLLEVGGPFTELVKLLR